MRWGQKGKGAWITVFTNPGHAYAKIAGLRLDTSVAGMSRTRGLRRLGVRERPALAPDAALAARLREAPPRLLLRRPPSGLAPGIRLGEDPNAEVAVPGMGGRMSTVIKAKINKMLDKAEDPSETLEYSYAKQMELLQNVKKGVADVVTAKKRLQLQQQKLEQQVVKLDTQARQALAAGREDLARTALERKQFAQTELQTLDQQVVELEAAAAGADRQGAEAALQARAVPHQEGGHQGPVLGCRGAGQDLRGRDRRGRGDGRRRHGDAARAWTRPRTCAPAPARWRSSRRSGAFDDNLTLTAGQDDIDRQLHELTSGSQVDDDLAQLKAELGQGAAPAPALEEGKPADQPTQGGQQ